MPIRLKFLLALAVGLCCLGRVEAQVPTGCVQSQNKIPTMTIWVYNDSGARWLFPVYTTGQHYNKDAPPGPPDVWMQACFGLTKAQVQTGQQGFNSQLSYRFYLTKADGSEPLGIPPKTGLSLTIPLYTQLVKTPKPNALDQYVDWWNGATIQLFYSQNADGPPRVLRELYEGKNKNLPNQKELTGLDPSTLPSCDGCTAMKFFTDTADLPLNAPSQLLELTLAARIGQCPDDDIAKCRLTDVPNTLDLTNVDFDVSYVNIAYGPAAMGPLGNDQVGYVGTPQPPAKFSRAVGSWLGTQDSPGPGYGWPQFVYTFADGTKRTLDPAKVPSPLDIFPRLTDEKQKLAPPPDYTPLPASSVFNPTGQYKWPDPRSLWTPVAALFHNWITAAGTVGKSGSCAATRNANDFCDAIVNVKALMQANYNNYSELYDRGECGTKGKEKLTDNLMVAHVYGWTPFSTGCGAAGNLLENTPPDYKANNYERYAIVKEQFDKLNYGTLENIKYDFNPYVELIHGKKYADVQNAYAYSVDDAVGNIQAEGVGIIIDVGGTDHLENKNPARPPITVNYGLTDRASNVSFTQYALCNDSPGRWKPVKPYFTSFIINANNPKSCPIYMQDSKNQHYTFRIETEPENFPFFQNQSQASPLDPITRVPIRCNADPTSKPPYSGNTDVPPYYASSRQWCCDLSSQNGVYTYQTPEAHSAHKSVNYYAIAHAPQGSTHLVPSYDITCTRGTQPWKP